jgi:acyl dehydratase
MSIFTFRLEDQRRKIGQKIGTSDWVLITQEMTDRFGNITLDPDPMHMEPEWCEKHSPFDGTVAFGFQTISMLTHLFHSVVPYDKYGNISTGGYPLNYGFDYLRLTGPVPIGSRIRAHFTLKDVREHGASELIQTVRAEIEVEGCEVPALVADWLFIWVTAEGHDRIRHAAAKA